MKTRMYNWRSDNVVSSRREVKKNLLSSSEQGYIISSVWGLGVADKRGIHVWIMLSEINQSQKDKYYMILLIWSIQSANA